MRLFHRFCQCRWFVVALVFASGQAIGQEDEQPYLPGLVVTYRGSNGSQVRRIEDSFSAQPSFGAGDVRMRDSVSSVHWKGLLWAQGAGDYRLHVYGDGKVAVRLAGRDLISETLNGKWVSSPPISLSFDYHPLEVEVSGQYRDRGVALFWSGPQFGIEPIAPRYLWHDRKETVELDFERGRLLNAALRCTACHAMREAERLHLAAPSLSQAAGNLHRQWLIERLMQQNSAAAPIPDDDEPARLIIARRMPFYGLSRDDAEAIAAFLLADRSDVRPPKPVDRLPAEIGRDKPRSKSDGKSQKEDKAAEKKEPPSAAEGERLFLTLGCLACHQWGDLGASGLFGGGDLTEVAAKRPAHFFHRWLVDPASLNPRHRMPVFELNDDERTSLSLFLARGGQGEQSDKIPRAAAQEFGQAKIARGRELVLKLRCGRCHELPDVEDKLAADRLMLLFGTSDWDRSCAGKRTSAKSGWGYDLPAEAQKWLQAYFEVAKDAPEPEREGHKLLLSNNCLACHAREGYSTYEPLLPPRLADKLAAVGQKHEQLAPLIPSMTPPSLNSIGDKLTGSALKNAISRSEPPHRSYLLVRMPKFALEFHDEGALISHFWRQDQVPNGVPRDLPENQPSEAALAAAGGRLVSTDGFGCVSCHQIGSVVPDRAPLNARGPALSQIDRRIRREWFDRFMPNPARVVPRMEMPSVQIPVKGVLGDRVDAQLAAVWHVLSRPGFEPPEPNPVRVLRRSGIAERREPPIVIGDVVKLANPPKTLVPSGTFIHPLVIGLPNRQNFLYDFHEGRLALWWLGDAARQRTKGKSWHWEPGGPLVMQAAAKTSELAILRGGRQLAPRRHGQHVADLQGYNIDEREVRLAYSLGLGIENDASAPTLRVQINESWRFESIGAASRAIRELTVRWDAQEHDLLRWEVVPVFVAKEATIDPQQGEVRLEDGVVRLTSGNSAWSLAADGSATSPAVSGGENAIGLQLEYVPLMAPDTIDSPPVVFSVDAAAVEVAPGFTGRRLPLPTDIMPTALAWRKDRSSPSRFELVFGSLKGQVIAARDSDGDGVEDAAAIVADGLAAPYGIAAADDALHVLAKGALLEVKDGAVKVLASGWGHTDDYHDWAVGLPRNEKGEYFIGLPCQQDERSSPAAKHRGAVLKLTPRMPTDDNPLRYEMEVVSTGHRFPMGLDLDRDGELFVTDNQGNYNPFNELNHARPGAFFGFINANERKDASFTVPPLDEPAIDIPHPWTRSVNGICFLHTPQPLQQAGKDAFGPLEGHLVGCEYDTRRLVRMTLQKVGNTYQGAAYPLSVEPSSPENGFLGPVVCAVSPRGELYVGSIRDSGWGAGNNIGEVVQIRIEPQKLPAGIAEVRATADGFVIHFFRPIDRNKAADPSNYLIASYRRESTPAYGGPDLDRRIEKLGGIDVAPDGLRVTLKLPELREGFVYEFQLKNLTSDGSLFHPAEAHYTLRRRP